MASSILSGDRWLIVKKDLAIIFGLFLLIAILLIFGKGISTISYLPQNQSQTQKGNELPAISVKSLNIKAKVASKPDERKNGLSKQESMPLDEGMLFVFENPGLFGIWMKDMKFAIDIIWIDENKKIVDIAANTPPEPSKKEKELTIYRPTSNAKYVLEINAGLSTLNNLQIGDQVNFEL